MAKKEKDKKEAPKPKRNNGVEVTLKRKAKKVLKSSGYAQFLKWADNTTTGGRRLNSARPSFSSTFPKEMKRLEKEASGSERNMDNPSFINNRFKMRKERRRQKTKAQAAERIDHDSEYLEELEKASS